MEGCVGRRFPYAGILFFRNPIVSEELDLVGIAVEEHAHATRHAVRIDAASVGVAEDFFGGIVAADNDEAAFVADVKDVVAVVLACSHHLQSLGLGG